MSIFLIATAARASTYVPVEDTLVYDLLTRLEARGVIRSGLLDTKPISRKEAFRLLHEAEINSESGDDSIKAIVGALRDRLGPEPAGTEVKPVDRVYAVYVHTNAGVHVLKYGNALENEQPFNYNNNGDLFRRGPNERFGFSSRIDDWGPLSAAVNPEFRYPTASYIGYPDSVYSKNELVLKKAYGVADLGGWDIVLGKDSQWWGPGYHGALLLTNNAEPFTVLRLTNPEPVHLPWIFKSLGPFRLNVFIAHPEKIGSIGRPYLYGIRFDFKPHPNIEIGLEKTALIGGAGHPLDYHDWINSMLPFSDAENRQDQPGGDPGDQRVGLDFKYRVPWRVQPVQIYLEADGEDEYHNLPNLWAFVGGFYLPRILNADNFDFRLEYATTRGRKRTPYNWYVHYRYTSYTHDGNIIGHHMGTASNDWFAQVSFLLPEKNARLFLSWDREEHNLYVAGPHETFYDVAAGAMAMLTKHIDLSAQYRRGWLYNLGNAPNPALPLSQFGIEAGYRF